MPDVPAGTEITHYRHGRRSSPGVLPCLCGQLGWSLLPAFATSGGAGIKPSINGVPPIYSFAREGQTLFESLALSLIIPTYQPQVASERRDDAWWLRKPVVQKSKEGARRGLSAQPHVSGAPGAAAPRTGWIRAARIVGKRRSGACERLIFEMGECRPKRRSLLVRPFLQPIVAHKIKRQPPFARKKARPPGAEFSGLFLQDARPAMTGKKTVITQRPSVIDQMAAFELGSDVRAFPFRCVGLRTDMKAKIFEWLDAGFEVPPKLLGDPASGLLVREAIALRHRNVRERLPRSSNLPLAARAKSRSVFATLKSRMQDDYWASLAEPFRQYVLGVGRADKYAGLAHHLGGYGGECRSCLVHSCVG